MKTNYSRWLSVAICSILPLLVLQCSSQKLADSPSFNATQNLSENIGGKQLQINSNAVTVSGVSIPLDKIPLHSGYTLPIKSLKENENSDSLPVQKWVYASENKKNIVIVTDRNTEDYTLELFDSEGKSKWKTITRGCYPSFLYLSDDGRFTHVLCRAESDNGDISNKLLTYDQNGVEISRVDSVAYVYTGNSNQILYYIQCKSFAPFKTKNTLYAVDFSKNRRWAVDINSAENIYCSVSKSGNSAICKSGNKVYSINEKGEIIWVKPFSFNNIIGLSSNGNLFFRIDGFKSLEVYRNSNFRLMFKVEFNEVRAVSASIIDGSVVVVEVCSAPGVCWVYFYNMKGEFLSKVSIDCNYLLSEVKYVSKGIYYIYGDGIKLLEYRAEW